MTEEYNTPMPPLFAPGSLKRLTRADTPRPYRFQATAELSRDLDILLFLDRVDYATSDQIVRAVGGSQRNVKNRLRLFFDHKVLTRPPLQHVLLHGFHNPPLIYGLGAAGKRLLIEHGKLSQDGRDYTRKAARVVPLQLAHTIEVTELILQFEAACRDHTQVRLFDQHELLEHMPDSTRASRHPFACEVVVELPQLSDPLALTVIPDRLLALGFANGTRSAHAIEWDRGTESIGTSRTRLVGKSSFRKKLMAYWHAWRQQLHTSRWGFTTGFRVLTITTTEARLRSMIGAQREVAGDTGLFLYTTAERLLDQGPFGSIWSSSSEDGLCLLPPALQPALEVPRGR